MKPYVRGKTVFFREVREGDAEFILRLRCDPERGKHLSKTVDDIELQKCYIKNYLNRRDEYYFIISDWSETAVGTVRIYDIQDESFCWGSWILGKEAAASAGIESALMIYDFAFYSLHYARAHFDVRKENKKVIEFHKRFGASIVREDADNLYFHYGVNSYNEIRQKYRRYLR